MCKYKTMRTKKKVKYWYCKKYKREIIEDECGTCKSKEYKQYKKMKQAKIKTKSHMTSRRSRATDIPQKVKEAVWKRDGGMCVNCGNNKNIMPNAHYISRHNGGLGIEENVVTLCTELTEKKCHKKYDDGTREEHDEIEKNIKNYLKNYYGSSWKEKDLIYNKYKGE